MTTENNIEQAYKIAAEQYEQYGVDTDAAIEQLAKISISLHCWQGDDVGGFEGGGDITDSGIMATGNYPGRARTADELRADLEKTYSLIPGKHRLNLHAIYAETGGKKIERNELQPEHFKNWIDWAVQNKLGLDFNPSCFAHPKASTGFTLASRDESVRNFWVQHCIACRKIGLEMGNATGSPCVTNIWIPDGYKDIPADRKTPRKILKKSLDEVLAEKLDKKYLVDAVESKLFGIGSESYVVGSHEFYLAYAMEKDVCLCLDTGHYHPTEVISDKISAVMCFLDELLLHISRGVRWDSDHVVILSDEPQAIAKELVRGNYLDKIHIGLDFFDASINRIAAWTIGTRSMLKALLIALLEPAEMLKKFEADGDFTCRLAVLEELKSLPYSAVWDYYCLKSNAPVGKDWLKQVKLYEKEVLSGR